jgi:transcriptional regulator with XRE-family HTH domain
MAWQKMSGLTDAQLSKLLDVDPSYISHIRAGRRNPSPKLSLRIEEISDGLVSIRESLFPNQGGQGE